MRWRVATLLVLAILLVGNWRLVLGRSSGVWDADSQFAPYQMLVADHARAGRFLLWNPWSNGGSPDGFEPQFGAFSPIATGLGLLTGGREYGFRILWLVVWAIGGLGIVLLGRHLGAPPWGACVAALGFMASGIYTGHAQATPFLHSIGFLPLVLWRLDVAVRARALWPALQAGTLYGLSALEGHPAFTVVTAGYALLWVAGRVASEAPGGERRARLLLVVAIFLASAFLVLSPTYCGLLVEGRGFTQKLEPLDRATVTNSNVLEPGALQTLASPYLLIVKAVNRETLWPRTDTSSCSLYFGGLAAVLAVLGVAARPRDRFRLWLAGLSILFLVLAFGEPVPFRGWLYDLAPPTRYFRHAAIFRVYTMLTLVVLALYASKDLAEAEDSRAWRLLPFVALVAAVFAALAYASVLRVASGVGGEGTLAHAHFALAWPGALALALVGWRNANLRSWLIPALAVALASADALMALELDRGTMYLPRERWKEIDARLNPSLDLMRNGLDRSLNVVFDGALDNKNLCIKLPVLQSYGTLENPFHKQWVEEPTLARAALGPERTWFSSAVAWVAPSQVAFEAFRQRTLALGAPPLVLHSREALLAWPRAAEEGQEAARVAELASLPAARPVPVVLERYQPNELTFTVDCPEAGWLWVTDRWAPGWRASVNGRDVEIAGGNFIFRAVPVSAGTNAVAFRYQPFGYPWLLLLSWGTLAAAVGPPLLSRRRWSVVSRGLPRATSSARYREVRTSIG